MEKLTDEVLCRSIEADWQAAIRLAATNKPACAHAWHSAWQVANGAAQLLLYGRKAINADGAHLEQYGNACLLAKIAMHHWLHG